MKKLKKILFWIISIIFVIFLIETIYDYYRVPLITFFGVEDGDELLENGKKAFIIRKDKYEKGDIIIAKDVDWEEEKKYQVSRKIVGLPGEYVEEGRISLHNDQYAVQTSVTGGELFSAARSVLPASNIYGVIVGKPLTDFKSNFFYFFNRTIYLPEYLKLKLTSSFLSLRGGEEVTSEWPTVTRTISLTNRSVEDFVVESTVEGGENLWGLIIEELLTRDNIKTKEEAVIEAGKIKDRLKLMSGSELKEFGFSSGDIDILEIGDKINILKIIGSYNIDINKEYNKKIKNIKANNKIFTCGVSSVEDSDGNSYPTTLINNQCWMAKNLNVGIKIADTEEQSDNNIMEKYCYNNDEANCDDFGGLYQWNELMQYSTNEGAQGFCPEGWHIPTDAEQHSLEKYFSTGTCDPIRSEKVEDCLPAGTILKEGGSSGFNVIFADSVGEGHDIFSSFWSSSESGNRAWQRGFATYSFSVVKTTIIKTNALSVRCLKD